MKGGEGKRLAATVILVCMDKEWKPFVSTSPTPILHYGLGEPNKRILEASVELVI